MNNSLDIADELTAAETRAVAIDPVLIRDEYIRLPADLAHWNAKLALAMEREMSAELLFDKTEAMLAIEWRETLADSIGKATEAMVANRVKTDERFITARMDYIEARADLARVKGTVGAILAKKDMLVSLGAHIRKELEGSPSIREQSRHAHGGTDY